MELVLIWLLFGFVSWFVAFQRGGTGCLYLVLGLLLGPFGLIMAFVSGGSSREAYEEEPTLADELERLADLRDRGVLTEEEFREQKRRVLGDGADHGA